MTKTFNPKEVAGITCKLDQINFTGLTNEHTKFHQAVNNRTALEHGAGRGFEGLAGFPPPPIQGSPNDMVNRKLEFGPNPFEPREPSRIGGSKKAKGNATKMGGTKLTQ